MSAKNKDDVIPGDNINFGHLIPDNSFATIPNPTPAKLIFEHVSIKELVILQFHDTLCFNISRYFIEGVLHSSAERTDT